MANDYSDIIDMPHYEPQNHKRMSAESRAAQFSSFAALNGHEEAIQETARLTGQRLDLSADETASINAALSALKPGDDADILFFEEDARKEGGCYMRHRGCLKKIDNNAATLVFHDGRTIKISDIAGVKS